MTTFSNSRLSSFEQCPQKFKFHYIDKVETEILRTIETFMGELVHLTLEKLYKDLKFLKTNTEEELIQYYDENWEKSWDDRILIVKDYSKDNYKKMGEKMISDYYNHYAPFNQGRVIGLETQDFLDLDENYKIHIRIDRLMMMEDGVYEIHDYKTNSNLKTQPELDEDRQLAIYALGVKKLYPDAKEIILVWHFLAFDKEMRSTRTEKQLEDLRVDILSLIAKINNEKEFKPMQSALCDYCEYKALCPVWKHLCQLEKKSVEEFKVDEGLNLVNTYSTLKEAEKTIQEQIDAISIKIKDFSDFFGTKKVYGTNHAVTIWSKEGMKFPGKADLGRQKFVGAIKALNLYDRFAEVDNWNLEKEFESLDAVEKQVLEHFGKKQKTIKLYLNKRDK
ncbi:MAG: PD-(D/E)XK nuclease family protein [Candidatus Woesearchaeota archaeon]|jgi:putative RecB family exonuclease